MPYKDPDKEKAYQDAYHKDRYRNDAKYRARVRERARQRYHTDPEYRRKCLAASLKRVRMLNKKRRITRGWVIQQLGGKCVKCGYDKTIAALDIHHKNGVNDLKPSEGLRLGRFYKWWKQGFIPEDIKANMELLCANCHRELHFN